MDIKACSNGFVYHLFQGVILLAVVLDLGWYFLVLLSTT